MPRLQMGDSGLLVERWNEFLKTCGVEHGNAVFDQNSVAGTIAFQKGVNKKAGQSVLTVDGVAGNMTLGRGISLSRADDFDARLAARLCGYPYPAMSAQTRPALSQAEMHTVFGKIEYERQPEPDNPERVVFKEGWEKENLTSVSIPQLKGIAGGGNYDSVRFHKTVERQLCGLWAAWEKAGLLPNVKSFEGTFSRRLKRGSDELSNHAWGTAFDINYSANRLYAFPSTPDELGCVYSLVPLANKYGFNWGGHYLGRLDGMHFEATRILTAAELQEAGQK